MTQAEQVARCLRESGLVADEQEVRKVVDGLLKPDYIPNGGPVREIESEIFPAPSWTRCGCATGNDIQSGPIYCGDPAVVCFKSNGGLACACKRHESGFRRFYEQKYTEFMKRNPSIYSGLKRRY